MDASLLFPPLAIDLLSVVVFYAVVRASGRKRTTWESIGRFAELHRLEVRESSYDPFAYPEASGTFARRPIYLRVGGAPKDGTMIVKLCVGHRLVVSRDVYLVRGDISPLVLGSPRWKKAVLGSPPANQQVRVTSPSPEETDRFHRLLSIPAMEDLLRIVGQESSLVRIRPTHLDTNAIVVPTRDPAGLEAALRRVERVVSALEEASATNEIRSESSVPELPPATGASRRLHAAMMFGVLACAVLSAEIGTSSDAPLGGDSSAGGLP